MMGFTKFKADSKIGKKLLASGRSLTAHPTQSAEKPVILDREVTFGCTVEFVLDDVVMRGIVKWTGEHRGEARVGISVPSRKDLVFVPAELCAVV